VSNERGGIFDQWLTILGIYFLVGVLFLYSGKGKLFDDDGKAPSRWRSSSRGRSWTRCRASTRPG
jgi:hypothetical protein